MQIPGALLESGWEELDAAVAKQAKLKKQQRELGLRRNDLERETNSLQEVFVRQAQELYNQMSAGELDNDKAEKAVAKDAEALKRKLGELEAEKADVQRRLEALRRSLEASDGQVEMVLKMGAHEQMAQLVERFVASTQEGEQVIFQAQEIAKAGRNQYQAIQFIDQYLGRDGSVAPRQIGPNGSFGSGPENALMVAQQRTQESGAEGGRIREALAGEGEAVPEGAPIDPNVTITRSGTVGIFLPDDD